MLLAITSDINDDSLGERLKWLQYAHVGVSVTFGISRFANS
jgi:hypothetical protein